MDRKEIMDPTAALAAMHAAIADGDRTQARDIAFDLIDWLDRGGFPPAGLTPAEARTAALAVMDE